LQPTPLFGAASGRHNNQHRDHGMQMVETDRSKRSSRCQSGATAAILRCHPELHQRLYITYRLCVPLLAPSVGELRQSLAIATGKRPQPTGPSSWALTGSAPQHQGQKPDQLAAMNRFSLA
jgi:hypothetical protein